MRESLVPQHSKQLSKIIRLRKSQQAGFAKLAVPALTCPSLSCLPLSTDKGTQQYPRPVPTLPSSQNEQHHPDRRAQAAASTVCSTLLPPQTPSWPSPCLRPALSLNSWNSAVQSLLTSPPWNFLPVAPQGSQHTPPPPPRQSLLSPSLAPLTPLYP